MNNKMQRRIITFKVAGESKFRAFDGNYYSATRFFKALAMTGVKIEFGPNWEVV